MMNFFKKLFGGKEECGCGCNCNSEKVEPKVEEIKVEEAPVKELKVRFEEEEELRVAALMGTILAAGNKPLSNFKVVNIKRV